MSLGKSKQLSALSTLWVLGVLCFTPATDVLAAQDTAAFSDRKPTNSIKVPDQWVADGVKPYISPDGQTIYLVERYGVVHLWKVFIGYWPLWLGLLLVLGAIFGVRNLRRQWPRVQTPGEPYCNNCNYQLTKSKAKKCPECGVDITGTMRVIGKSRVLRLAPAIVLLILFPVFYGLGFVVDMSALGVDGWIDVQSHALYKWAEENSLEIHKKHSSKRYRVYDFNLVSRARGSAIFDEAGGEPVVCYSYDSRYAFVTDGVKMVQWNIKRGEQEKSLTAYRFDKPYGNTAPPHAMVSTDGRALYTYDFLLHPLEWNLIDGSVRRLPLDDFAPTEADLQQRGVIEQPNAVDLRPWPYHRLITIGLEDRIEYPAGVDRPVHTWLDITENKQMFVPHNVNDTYKIEIWDLAQRKQTQSVLVPAGSEDYHFAASDDASRLFVAVADKDGRWSVGVWDTLQSKWIGGFRLPRTFKIEGWFLLARGRDVLVLTGRDLVHDSWPAYIWQYDVSEFLPEKKNEPGDAKKSGDADQAGNSAKSGKSGRTGNQKK